jgi:hypothetical protein
VKTSNHPTSQFDRLASGLLQPILALEIETGWEATSIGRRETADLPNAAENPTWGEERIAT